jgi:hypothetical protein
MSWRLLVLGIPTADVRRSSPQLSAELASTATFKTLTLHLGCIMSNMSNHAQYPWTGQDRGMVSNGEKSRERRQWVRFILPNMLTRLSWANGTETVTHLVSLVDVSANGAAVNMQVIMDVKPVADRPCMIHFENGGVSTGPIPANLVAMETMDSGRTLAKFAFDSVLANRDLIPHQRERRAWQRVVPRERRACLSWRVGDDTISVPGEVQNISGGGVAVQTDVAPPWNQTIWLSLGPVGEEAGPAECRLVGFRNDQPGKLIARFAFVDLCPLQLYQAAIEIPK